MVAEVTKPDFSYVWSSGGANVLPSAVKIQTGWTAEVPPFQWENALQNRQDNAIVHLFQKGISEWDANSNYYFTTNGVRSYVQGSDGIIYVAVQDSINQNPTTDLSDTYWKVAFAAGDVVYLSQAAGDLRYAQRANNLSDLANVSTARSNLGAAPLVSPALTGTPTAPTAANGTNTTQIATTAFVNTIKNTATLASPAGIWKDASTGFMLQWVTFSTVGGVGGEAVNFPTAFTTACIGACPIITPSPAAGAEYVQIISSTVSGLVVGSYTNTSGPVLGALNNVKILAFGY